VSEGRRVVVLDTPDDIAAQAAIEFEVRARAAIDEHGWFAVALSGGKTPRALFALLASPQFAENIEWDKVHFFWSDERCLPPDNIDSNFKQAEDALLGPIQEPKSNVHRMQGELEPHTAALNYSDELHKFFGDSIRFDLIYLGLGEDGHTASLFPGHPALDESAEPCVAVHAPANRIAPWRLTLTFPVLNAPRSVIFLAEGEAKASVLARVLEGPRDVRQLPAQGVSPERGSLVWLTDRAAAALLKSRV
jgi:6-phosphogluconolactonase